MANPIASRAWRVARVVAALLSVIAAACGENGSSGPSPGPSTTPSAFDPAAFREAARITGLAEIEVLHTARPGLYERDIKTVIDAVFSREGVTLLAFPHIVASGPNSVELHYAGDSRQLQDDDLLLVDIGATHDAHCADVTRTYPVSGRFTSRQRDLYALVLEAQREAAARMRPGVDTLGTIHAWVKEYFRTSPLRARDAAGVEQTMDHFFVHFIGHYVGRTVHGEDTGWSSSLPIQPGQVFTLEPGIYLASEGLGIRIEDTYLVTANGIECLSPESPKEVAEIEREMSTPTRVLAAPGAPIPVAPQEDGRRHMEFGPG